MRRVIIESPFAGDVARNLRYLRACALDCLRRGEAPFASHGFFPLEAGGPLDDADAVQRELGIRAGFAWREAAELTAVYTDLGITRGMRYGIEHAVETCRPIEYRTLGGWE
jgi:hypothetical protein